MGISTSTGTLTAGQSRTFNLSPASAVTLTLSPNVRVTITETPATVAATGLGGNASRVHEPRLPGTFTYGPYTMGGTVVVEVDSNSGSSVVAAMTTSALDNPSRPAISVGLLGDSRTAQGALNPTSFNGTNGPPPDTSHSNGGWYFWWKFFCRAPLEFTNYAVNGATSATVVSGQLDDAIAADHDIYALWVGINDTSSGALTLSNITTIYAAVKAAGKRLLILTDSPGATMSSDTIARVELYTEGVRALALSDPDTVIVADIKSALSNPASSSGASYDAGSNLYLTYDGTHPNLGALVAGKIVAAAAPWTRQKVDAYYNGGTRNLLANSALGGSGGSASGANNTVNGVAGTQTNTVAGLATSWTLSSSDTVTVKAYKVRNVAQVLEAGDTPVLGQRCKITGNRLYHYIVIETGTAASTLPTSTTLFAETEPDGAGGAKYLTLPANDLPGMENEPFYGVPYEGQYIELVAGTANFSVFLNQYVDAGATTFAVGDRVKSSGYIQYLESSWQSFSLRQNGLNINTKTNDAFGPGYAFSNATLKLEPNLHGLFETPESYTVPAATTRLRYSLYLYSRASSVPTRCIVHHLAMENLDA